MATLFVDKVDPQSGTSLEIGSSGDTITIPSGATIANSGTATGFGGTNTPAFHARGSGSQSATIGSSTKLTFGTEEVDTDSAFASDRFTVPSGKAGTYYIYSAARHNTQNGSGTSDVSLRIFKNGSFYNNHSMGYYDNTAQIDFSSVSAVINLAVSDYIEIYLYIDTGSNNAVYDDRMFLGYKLIT
jgi:hypothetical protein